MPDGLEEMHDLLLNRFPSRESSKINPNGRRQWTPVERHARCPRPPKAITTSKCSPQMLMARQKRPSAAVAALQSPTPSQRHKTNTRPRIFGRAAAAYPPPGPLTRKKWQNPPYVGCTRGVWGGDTQSQLFGHARLGPCSALFSFNFCPVFSCCQKLNETNAGRLRRLRGRDECDTPLSRNIYRPQSPFRRVCRSRVLPDSPGPPSKHAFTWCELSYNSR